MLVRCALVQESDLDVGALAYPAGARLAPGDELLEGMVDRDGREQLGQDDGVLHGEAAALRQRRRARVRGVADEHHPAGAPLVAVDLLRRAEVHRLVGAEERERVRRRAAEVGEALAEPVHPAFETLVERLRTLQLVRDVRGATAEREDRDVTVRVELHRRVRDNIGRDRRPPVHLAHVARRRRREAHVAHL